MNLTAFLRISIGLTNALGRLHERGIIHRDVNPANVTVDSTSGKVWLTGFGIASDLPRERQAPEPPETIAGTLAYMAPEQTGRMNRSIDFFENLVSHPDIRHLLLIGAYRDNEVSPSHPLMLTLDAIRKTEATVQHIVLAPLSLHDLDRFSLGISLHEYGRGFSHQRLFHHSLGTRQVFAATHHDRRGSRVAVNFRSDGFCPSTVRVLNGRGAWWHGLDPFCFRTLASKSTRDA
ncbi:MAG: protein kinase [Chthoniobacterales bacterium]